MSIKHRGKDKRLTDEERRRLNRRQAIEPITGHLKTDHDIDHCHPKGSKVYALHAVLCAAGCWFEMNFAATTKALPSQAWVTFKALI